MPLETNARATNVRCTPRWPLRVLFVVLTVGWALPARPAGQDEIPSEAQVKAAFLFNFAKFIEWPSDTFANANAHFVVGILGKDPVGAELERMVAGKSANGRELRIRRFERGQDLRGCQILFISSSEKKDLSLLLRGLRDSSVLTVGDTEQFVALGGTLRFFMEKQRVRFEINTDATTRSRLHVSSKLLSVAWLTTDSHLGGGN